MRIAHAKIFLIAWEESLELVWVHLNDGVERMKNWEDSDIRDALIDVGHMFFLYDYYGSVLVIERDCDIFEEEV